MASLGAAQASHMLDKQPNKPATLLHRQTVMSGDCLFVLRVCVCVWGCTRDEGSWWQPFWQLLKVVWVSVRHQSPRLRETAATCLPAVVGLMPQVNVLSFLSLVFSWLCFCVFPCVSEDRNYTGCCYLLEVFFFLNALALPYEILGGTSYEVGLG